MNLKTKLKLIENWRERIKKAGLRHCDFCKKAGIAESTFSQYVNQIRMPRMKAIEKIESALKAEGV